jgi:hypothetical protein
MLSITDGISATLLASFCSPQVLNHEWLRTVAPDVTIKSDIMVHLRVGGWVADREGRMP